MALLDLPAGAVLAGRYRVDRALATGGTSRIYLGNPLRGAGTVAIKQLALSAEPQERAEEYNHFRREFELLSTLTHPSLPMALDFFEEGGLWYLVEEFVPGESLQERLERLGHLPLDGALAIAVPLLEVLEYLHEHKVVYRDLKPSNVLITHREVVRLIDFGAARRWRAGATRDTVPLGTPGFAPPEQYGSAQTDARSDIYSVGALLHQMLTGLDPMEGQPWVFKPPHEVDRGIPAAISDAVMRALSLSPGDRFASAEAMRRALVGEPEVAVPVVPPLLSAMRQLRRRYQYVGPAEYWSPPRERRRLGIAGGLVVALDVVFWAHGMPGMLGLLTGTFGLAALAHQHRLWSRYHLFVVETFDEGVRMRHPSRAGGRLPAEWKEFTWAEIRQVRLVFPDHGAIPLFADIATAHDAITLPGDWPGTQAVVDEVVATAGLVETAAAWDQYAPVGTHARTFTRVR